MKTEAKFGRREFTVKKAAHALATVAVCEGMMPAESRAATTSQCADTIPARTLGKTGLKLPLLGYGCAALS